MRFAWEFEDLEDESEEGIFPDDDPDEEITRNPRHHVSDPKSCCACHGPFADLTHEQFNEILMEWVIARIRPKIARCQLPMQTRCAS